MLEIYNKDIFKIASGTNEAICITTNGMIKNNGNAVMGKGIALTADNYFHISKKLGEYLNKYGNRAFDMGFYSAFSQEPHHVLTFPTKHDWRYNSDINLIKTSAEQIVRICDARNITKCYLPPVGCANGHLDYEKTVKPVLSNILDDRFIVIIGYE
jgi:hypothetical protein